jgi:hypothetical protein
MTTVTEEEAKDRWCPLRRPEPASQLKGCIGSKCMWWRWLAPPVMRGNPATGYCGAAGKPDN